MCRRLPFNEKGPMKLSPIGPYSGKPEIFSSAPAFALLDQAVPFGDRGGQGRDRLADRLVIRRPLQRLEGEAAIPDLAVAGVVVADQGPRRGLGRTDDDESGHCDAGGSAEGGKAA